MMTNSRTSGRREDGGNNRRENEAQSFICASDVSFADNAIDRISAAKARKGASRRCSEAQSPGEPSKILVTTSITEAVSTVSRVKRRKRPSLSAGYSKRWF
jgi:hypothetical protein